MRDLSLRMIASVWYPLNYFKLSFGPQDSFKMIANFVSERITIYHIEHNKIVRVDFVRQ
jgi:hypothetical protein